MFKSSRPGTAEIETLLVIPILLALLFLAGAAFKLGSARLANTVNAENHAYSQVVSGQDISPSADPLPFSPGITAARPDPALPDRFDVALEQQSITLPRAVQSPDRPITLTDQAIFLDPAWTYANFPQTGDDQRLIREWFETYAGESHPATLTDPLGLQPTWPP